MFNPFRNVENPKAVWAWGMYDLANQSFQLLINTLLFSLYFSKVVVGSDDRGRAIWGGMFFASNALVVLASVALGAIADARGWRKRLLIGSGLSCCVFMCCFPLLGPGDIALAVLLYVPAAFCCGIGENFLAAFLPSLASREQMGRVSAIGWTMSYLGALGLLGVCAAAVFGAGWSTPDQWRGLFLVAGLWFGLGILPAQLYLREHQATMRSGNVRGVVATTSLAFKQFARSLRETRRFAQLAKFLVIFFIYSMGTQTVVFFAGLIGDSLGLGVGELILMALVMALTAGISAVCTGLWQDRVGHRATIMAILAVWVLATAGLGWLQLSGVGASGGGGKRWFWIVCGGIGLGLGGIGTASRALVGAFTPEHRSAEFFGLWGMVYKLASIGGVLFGVVGSKSSYGIFLITGFFAAGLLLMLVIDPKRGMQAASEAEREQTRDAAEPLTV